MAPCPGRLHQAKLPLRQDTAQGVPAWVLPSLGVWLWADNPRPLGLSVLVVQQQNVVQMSSQICSSLLQSETAGPRGSARALSQTRWRLAPPTAAPGSAHNRPFPRQHILPALSLRHTGTRGPRPSGSAGKGGCPGTWARISKAGPSPPSGLRHVLWLVLSLRPPLPGPWTCPPVPLSSCPIYLGRREPTCPPSTALHPTHEQLTNSRSPRVF